MRSRHFRNGPAWKTNLAPALPFVPVVVEAPAEPELPRTQVMALLDVRGGGADSLFAKVLAYLRAVGSDEPGIVDRVKLREAGYLRYRRAGGCGWDEVTPAGLYKAQTLAREMAKRFAIHHVEIRQPARRSTFGPTASCSCGCWSSFSSKKNVNRLHADGEKHLADVKAGTWKKPRPVVAFMDEIAPPSFNFQRRT